MNNKLKILLVDDNKQFVEAVQLLLSKNKNYEVIGIANNGIELLAHKNLAIADIILLDIEMPGINGFELAQKINISNSHIKLIAVTMYQEQIYLQKLIYVGFRGFVNKLDITTQLFNTINSVANNNFVFPNNILLSSEE